VGPRNLTSNGYTHTDTREIHTMHRSYTRPAAATTAALAALLGLFACSDNNSSPTAPEATPSQALDIGNVITNRWYTRPDLPTARSHAAAATVNGLIYLIGGQLYTPEPEGLQTAVRDGTGSMAAITAPPLRSVDVYDPDRTFSPYRRAAPLPSARSQTNGAAVINGKIYVSGGVDSTSYTWTKTLFIYNPATNSWTKGADMPHRTSGGVSGVINGKLYVVTTPLVDAATGMSRAYRYDPATNNWTSLAGTIYPHYAGSGGAVGGKLYVVGAFAEKQSHGEVEEYDPATNVWTFKGRRPVARGGAAGAVINGKLYVAGGVADHSITDKHEVYDPANNIWTERKVMLAPRYGAAAVRRNGILYLLGGMGGSGLSKANEIYMP
jgi:N-acetylneuraminic acid mutarotase